MASGQCREAYLVKRISYLRFTLHEILNEVFTMSKISINLNLHYPSFIEKTAVYFLLRKRKKKYGVAFRKIKLYVGNKPAKGRCTLVDNEDYGKLAQYHWQLNEENGNCYYAIRLEGGKIIVMHRQITNAPSGMVVHHKDGNGLNNTKENLKIVTTAENNLYRKKRVQSTSSKYKGVCFLKSRRIWRAIISYNRIHKFLGHFENEDDAARAYDAAAKINHGEFAVLNFPQVAAKTDGKFAVLNFLTGL